MAIITARIDAKIDAAPFIPQYQGSSVECFLWSLNPNGNAMPIKTPSGIIINNEARILVPIG